MCQCCSSMKTLPDDPVEDQQGEVSEEISEMRRSCICRPFSLCCLSTPSRSLLKEVMWALILNLIVYYLIYVAPYQDSVFADKLVVFFEASNILLLMVTYYSHIVITVVSDLYNGKFKTPSYRTTVTMIVLTGPVLLIGLRSPMVVEKGFCDLDKKVPILADAVNPVMNLMFNHTIDFCTDDDEGVCFVVNRIFGPYTLCRKKKSGVVKEQSSEIIEKMNTVLQGCEKNNRWAEKLEDLLIKINNDVESEKSDLEAKLYDKEKQIKDMKRHYEEELQKKEKILRSERVSQNVVDYYRDQLFICKQNTSDADITIKDLKIQTNEYETKIHRLKTKLTNCREALKSTEKPDPSTTTNITPHRNVHTYHP
eukprot:TRINITY_DN517_c0_g1_i3.p2 TRINITY_DN517_c0_g1~~TRINITY_DN517_c0_g1_i3.p2  ORF type:complete len:367 (-),score=49.27 TRINITY_DN517_c0_g1_i3:19-1119(-)